MYWHCDKSSHNDANRFGNGNRSQCEILTRRRYLFNHTEKCIDIGEAALHAHPKFQHKCDPDAGRKLIHYFKQEIENVEKLPEWHPPHIFQMNNITR